MWYKKSMWVLTIALFALSFQSCTQDEDENLLDDTLLAQQVNQTDEQRGDNDPNGPNGQTVASFNSNLVTQWIDLFLELDRYIDGMRPNATARALAYINLAAYETAVPGMRGFVSNSDLISDLDISRNIDPRDVDWQIALNACYADVMAHFLLNVPANLVDEIAALETRNEDRLSKNRSDQVTRLSKEWGASVASQIISYSQTDEEAEEQILAPQPLSYEPPTGPGFWTYSAEQERALFPYWGKVRTFVISAEETSTIAPLAYSEDHSSPYFKEMEEVYVANNEARAKDGEALWIAEFWSDDVVGITFSPPARQFSIARQLIARERLNLEEALHLNMKLGFSLNDAAVSTWDDKYKYMVMRPNVFIHEFIDATYQTNLYRLVPWPNPTFPGYPSGHSCFASAAAGVFIDFLGNRTNFTDRSHEGRTEFRGAARSFDSFEEMAEENAFSRIPLGVHIRMDCAEGIRLGYEISNAVKEYRVKRRDNI